MSTTEIPLTVEAADLDDERFSLLGDHETPFENRQFFYNDKEYPISDEEQERRKEEREASARRYAEECVEAIKKLDKVFSDETSTKSDKFVALRNFITERLYLVSHSVNYVVDDILVIEYIDKSFHALAKFSGTTDSYFVDRLIEWGANKEAHYVSEYLTWEPIVTIDDERTDPEAVNLYRRYIDDVYSPEDAEWRTRIRYKPSELGGMLIEDFPGFEDIVNRIAKLAEDDPLLSTMDVGERVIADPYVNLRYQSKHSAESIDAGTGSIPGGQELAIEVASIFKLNPAKDLSQSARKQLFSYGVGLDEATYQRLLKYTDNTDNKSMRVAFAESLLATEFGDDYGDALLDIAERATPEQSKRIFELVNELRARTYEHAKLFAPIDPELAAATEKSLDESITGALVAIQEVAVNGSLHEDVAPHRDAPGYSEDGSFTIDIKSLDRAIEILQGLHDAFQYKHEIMSAQDLEISRVNQDVTQFTMYRFMSESRGNFLVYIRPEGAYGYDKTYEYGNKKGVEASVSFIINPTDPHALLMPKDPEGVSIRFDREGRLVSEAPGSESRDPARNDGLISSDVSSIMGPAKSLPVQIGRMVAAGNRIRARRTGTDDSLHHNTNHFEQEKYGTSTGFADMANKMINQIEALQAILNKTKFGRAVVKDYIAA